ncbi:hypothetical protein ACXWR7_12980, partial [Streptococcus pyogenes]
RKDLDITVVINGRFAILFPLSFFPPLPLLSFFLFFLLLPLSLFLPLPLPPFSFFPFLLSLLPPLSFFFLPFFPSLFSF